MEILLEIGGRTMTEEEQIFYRDKKNENYVSKIRNMGEDDVLPGVTDFLREAKANGYLTALGSASKNSALIFERLHLTQYFDAIVDSTKVSKAKPDPEVFLRGAAELGVPPQDCIVFEDAVAGIQAAHAGGMQAVGIGDSQTLPEADFHLSSFLGITTEDVEAALAKKVCQKEN